MVKKIADERISTGITNLDKLLGGGLLKNSLIVFAGTPGAGKTILSQQIIFHNASPSKRALIFQTLSEPTAKTLRYLQEFSFYDPKKLEDGSVQFVDLGVLSRTSGLERGISCLMEHIKKVKPAFVIIDSFRVFEDLASGQEDLRKFSYEVAINLMAWECTTFLLGEFGVKDLESKSLFSIVDAIFTLRNQEESGEQQRLLQIIKMRGTNHSRDAEHFDINSNGINIYVPRLSIRRDTQTDLYAPDKDSLRTKVGIPTLDALLGEGIPYGSSLLISGVSGTGKTLLSLEFIYRGAKDYDEPGIFFTFEETPERLLAVARGLGWSLEEEINRGKVEIVFIPQPDILVEKHLQMMQERITQLNAKRVAVDSVSLFLHKIQNLQIMRARVFELATLIQRAQAVGFFVTDIPYGEHKISRFGVEETLMDGVIILTATENGFNRERYIEIYKLRNTAHLIGRHRMTIGSQGITITPRA